LKSLQRIIFSPEGFISGISQNPTSYPTPNRFELSWDGTENLSVGLNLSHYYRKMSIEKYI
jgi:hypothetical protein